MSVARANFFKRIGEVELVLSDDSVQDGSLTDIDKNAKARVLRNGLAVVLFAILEDFIRQRTSEVLVAVGGAGIVFDRLPEKLRKAATVGFISTLGFRIKLQEDIDRLEFLQREAGRIASTAGSPFELSPFALAHSKSNLDAAEVKDSLAAFLVNDPWGSMTMLASRMNYGALPLEDAFTQAAKRRHAAAHQAGAITLLPDLVSFVSQARAIAASYDCLISKCYRLIRMQDLGYLNGNRISATECTIRRVEVVGGLWKQYVEGRARAVSTSLDEAALKAQATAAAHALGDFLVFVDSSSRPINWSFPSAV